MLVCGGLLPQCSHLLRTFKFQEQRGEKAPWVITYKKIRVVFGSDIVYGMENNELREVGVS